MGLRRFSNGRISRKRGEEPSLFASSSGSGDDRESEADRVDDESLVTGSRLLEKDGLEDELVIECFLVGRRSKKRRPRFCHFDNVLVRLLDVLSIDASKIPLQ